ncbi:DgyrCDS11914 [Dimorphilus gyrociliatus]|uniref:NADH dehydrogenase [ubiquinone] 1 beta subcomplex subunit 3 n=1 Tax=Dimorphilus gyrociliatus TaxID=2664684 RepID=A0A7I8W7D9_9ANNE|nr:DgyrCDS11914 [Dimorphilus gyrociliatus]
MGAEKTFKVPDWKSYKIDGIKELEWTRDNLARKGLKDPWLRNEVWRFQNHPGPMKNVLITFSRGFKYAVGLMAITIAVDKAFGITEKRSHINYKHPDADYHHH